jgi:prepilin-type N-terminal cleavage/methylation domain-containing protein
MVRQSERRRAAFTLIELLVVIAIIAILISLISAAVMRVRVLGPQTENFTRIQNIAQGISSVKSSRDQNGLGLSWIPSTGGFRLKSAYVVGDPELEVLLTAWPNLNYGATGLPPNVTLDANQTLMFFLTGGTVTDYKGFSNNPKQPFTAATPGESRRGPFIEVSAKLVKVSPANGQAWLVDPFGTPYAYFASVGGKSNNYAALGAQSFGLPAMYDGLATTTATGTVAPYKSSATKFINENGFQIISAGRDKTFGPGDLNMPATGAGVNNQANFTRTLLSAGIN